MTDQLSIFDQPQGPKTTREKFLIFHQRNPEVYEQLVRFARQAKRAGRKRISIAMLFERLRWDYYILTDDPNSEFKISNDYKPHYARLIDQQEPDLTGIFQLKALRAA